MRDRRPRLHFSFRSPFSWLGITRLRALVPDLDQRVRFIPYWDPDAETELALRERDAEFHYTQMTKAKHLYILHDTRRQAARLGVPMRWPIDDDPWWERPHLAWLQADQLGAGPAFYRAACAARWERGEDICTEAAIRALAAETDLPADALVGAVHSADIRMRAVDCLVTAYEDDIFGVPYFRLGHHRFWGLDRVADFAAALLGEPDAVPPVPEALAARVGAYDTDTAGGCG